MLRSEHLLVFPFVVADGMISTGQKAQNKTQPDKLIVLHCKTILTVSCKSATLPSSPLQAQNLGTVLLSLLLCPLCSCRLCSLLSDHSLCSISSLHLLLIPSYPVPGGGLSILETPWFSGGR